MMNRVERVNLRWSVNDFVSKVRETAADLDSFLQAFVESSSRLSKNVAGKVKA